MILTGHLLIIGTWLNKATEPTRLLLSSQFLVTLNTWNRMFVKLCREFSGK